MRRLILDDMLPRELAAELRARGRDAVTLAELGMEGASDAQVSGLDGVLITTVPLVGGAVQVRGNIREVVHRHAHEMATRPKRRYVG